MSLTPPLHTLAVAPSHGARHLFLQQPVNAICVEHVSAIHNHLHDLSLSNLFQTDSALPLIVVSATTARDFNAIWQDSLADGAGLEV